MYERKKLMKLKKDDLCNMIMVLINDLEGLRKEYTRLDVDYDLLLEWKNVIKKRYLVEE